MSTSPKIQRNQKRHRALTMLFAFAVPFVTVNCKPKSNLGASSVKGLVGIDSDGRPKALGMLPISHEPVAPRSAQAVNDPGIKYAEDLVRMPFLTLTECIAQGTLAPEQWLQFVQIRASMGDAHIETIKLNDGTQIESITVTDEHSGARNPTPCYAIGPNRASYAVINSIFGLIENKQVPDNNTVLAATGAFLAMRGFYVPGQSVQATPSFVSFVRMYQAENNSAPPNMQTLMASFQALDYDMNPCLLSAAKSRLSKAVQKIIADNYSCEDLGGGKLFGYRPKGSFADTKLKIAAALASHHKLVYGTPTAASKDTDKLWSLAATNKSWADIAKDPSAPAAHLAGYLAGQNSGSFDFNSAFSNPGYGPKGTAKKVRVQAAATGNFLPGVPVAAGPRLGLLDLPPTKRTPTGAKLPTNPGVTSFITNCETPASVQQISGHFDNYKELSGGVDSSSLFRDSIGKAAEASGGELKPMGVGDKVFDGKGAAKDLYYAGSAAGGNQQFYTDKGGNVALVSKDGDVQTFARVPSTATGAAKGAQDTLVTSFPYGKDASGNLKLGNTAVDGKPNQENFTFVGADGKGMTSTVEAKYDAATNTRTLTPDGVGQLTKGYNAAMTGDAAAADKILADGKTTLHPNNCDDATAILRGMKENQALMRAEYDERASIKNGDNGTLKRALDANDITIADLQSRVDRCKAGTSGPAKAGLRLMDDDDSGGGVGGGGQGGGDTTTTSTTTGADTTTTTTGTEMTGGSSAGGSVTTGDLFGTGTGTGGSETGANTSGDSSITGESATGAAAGTSSTTGDAAGGEGGGADGC